MMLKNLVRLEHEINEKKYQLFCENDSPLANIKEALFEFLKYVGKVEDSIKESQAQVAAKREELASAPVVEEIKE